MQLEHGERIRWCREISSIHKTMNADAGKKNVFDVDVSGHGKH